MLNDLNMLNELNKYKEKGSFLFNQDDSLATVCNAPKNCSGLYVIYAKSKDNSELIYIGISGRKGANGEIMHRKDGLRGRFLTGKTDGVLRKIYWPQKMKLENIETLNIYWYVTFGTHDQVFPRDLEIKLLTDFKNKVGKLPRWNRCI